MEITYLGQSSFKLRGKSATVITDPFDPKMMGMKFARVSADIVTVSHQHGDHNYLKEIEGEYREFSGPGEYEVKGVKIWGVATFHDSEKGAKRGKNTVYRIEIDRISIAHLGDLGHKLTNDQVENLDGVDILMVPVGGFYTINAVEAAAVVSQLEPKIIIPMHYKVNNMTEEIASKLDGVDTFLKEMGKVGITPVPKLVITAEKLPIEPTVVVFG